MSKPNERALSNFISRLSDFGCLLEHEHAFAKTLSVVRKYLLFGVLVYNVGGHAESYNIYYQVLIGICR